jgi:ABC-type multidrug transport system fused ATPase/permease subunit
MHRLRRLYGLMERGTRHYMLAALLLMPFAIAAEMLTIGAVIPLLALASDKGREPGALLADVQLPVMAGTPLVGAAVLLAMAAIAAAALRLLLVLISQRFVTKFGHELAAAIFSRMIRQPYSAYLQRNSSEVLSAMEKVQRSVFGVLQPAMQGIIASVIALFIVALLFLIDPLATLAGASCVAAAYAAIYWATRQRLRDNSSILARQATQRTKLVQESLGGIRDIILEQSYEMFERQFAEIDIRYRRAAAANTLIAGSPRYVVEASVVVSILAVVLVMSSRPGALEAAIPVLGALALGAQRLLPLVQQAWTGWASVGGNLHSLLDVADFVEPIAGPPGERAAALPLTDSIVLDRVSYSYDRGTFTLQDISLRIAKGERLGIAGPTGSGKSTFLDLLMGLLEPRSGAILVDGRQVDQVTRASWRAAIAHVPQAVFLADDTIAANIAFGSSGPIQMERIESAAKAALLGEFIAALPEGYQTRVGERGIRLSGGQRQRIGIARALYKTASLLILDEATNALDEATEAEVMQSIAELPQSLTIVIASHRRSTLEQCDRIVRFENGEIRGLTRTDEDATGI